MPRSKIKNKRALNLIAKRWAKSILVNTECAIAFSETELTEEEVSFIQDKVRDIAEKITALDPVSNSGELVEEYFE